MQAFIQTASERADGTRDSFCTHRVDCKYEPMPHHDAGLTWTASGYGSRIPTRYMVRWNGKWRRVYHYCYSNAGTDFIGRNIRTGLIVSSIEV